MLHSYFITALRNLRKNKSYTIINVLGLALGIACCLIIFVIVRYETSFDDFHGKAERIYRVNFNQQISQGRVQEGYNYTPLAETIRREVTGLEAVTGVYCFHSYQFSRENNLYEGKYAFFADQEYYDVFDVKWVAGNKNLSLTKPNTVVVTDTFAEQFLGGINNALGNTVLLENKLLLTVTGVVKTPPSNTDMPYSMLISFPSLAEILPESVDNWEKIGSGAAFIVFQKNTHRDKIYPQLKKIINQYLKPEVAKNTSFFLMPLNDNHDRNYDYSSFTYDFPVPVMLILSIIAGMIAFIACINFVNLATAQSLNRAKEVGIRKTLGSSRPQLIMQYLSEAFVITLFAVTAGIILSKIAMVQLNVTYGGNYLQFNFLKEPSTMFFIAGITMIVTFLAGFYPAFVLSGYRPASALKSQRSTGKSSGFSLRRILVVLQFAGAQILILVTIILINQISHFKERPLSFDPKTVVLLPHLRGNETSQYSKLDAELQKIPSILNYTFLYGTPNRGERTEFFIREDNKHNGYINYGDAAYLSTFNIKLIAGKNFSRDLIHASSEVLANETMVKMLGILNPESAIGTEYVINGTQVKILGVIKDFYTDRMSNKINPFTLQYDPEKITGVAMNITTGNVPETLAGIEKAWQHVYPDYICKYKFMDDVLNRQYGFFNTIFTFLGIASFLAIFIGCLGLYGLVSFMALQRTKEIGIRKVLGASIADIMKMFTKESLILILIAFAAAAPLAHITGKAMLTEFPERVKPGIEIFILTLLASLLIALLTVGYRSFSAAIQNPTESLRSE